MYEIKKTDKFDKWLSKLKDLKAKISIARRIERMGKGNFGDSKSISNGLMELRIDTGPGYRVYYLMRGKEIIILLHGGDKSTQQRDIEKAKEIAKEYTDE